MVASTQALIELRAYKKKEGFWEEKYRNKDIAIAWYEKAIRNCEKQDSLNTIYRNNDAEIIKSLNIDIKETNYQLNKEKINSKIARSASKGLAISLPVALALGLLSGFLIAK